MTAEPSDVANILVDLAQRETKTFSLQFAHTTMGELKSVTPLHLHPVKAAGFIVLKAPDVPSVLLELGYMSTKSDLEHLTSPVWRTKTAAALVQAIDTYFAPRLACRHDIRRRAGLAANHADDKNRNHQRGGSRQHIADATNEPHARMVPSRSAWRRPLTLPKNAASCCGRSVLC